jgi:hypothetical protein
MYQAHVAIKLHDLEYRRAHGATATRVDP